VTAPTKPASPSPAPEGDGESAPWYEADGSVTMLPAEVVARKRKLAAKVLALLRRFIWEDPESPGTLCWGLGVAEDGSDLGVDPDAFALEADRLLAEIALDAPAPVPSVGSPPAPGEAEAPDVEALVAHLRRYEADHCLKARARCDCTICVEVRPLIYTPDAPPPLPLDVIASLRAQLAASEAAREEQRATFLRSIQGQRESFERTRPLCSGHVDKMQGPCLGCRIDGLERTASEARERAERAEAALGDCLAYLWPAPDEGHTGFVDRLGMQFYRETGIWPPFKSEPMEIARPDVDREEASRQWRAWLEAKRDAAAAKAARALSAPAPTHNDGAAPTLTPEDPT
jgi:hypothetical protein